MLGRESGNRRSRYIAFRVADKHGELITAVAEIDRNENESPFPWGTWYHERAPEGDFEKVPRNYREMELNEGIAKSDDRPDQSWAFAAASIRLRLPRVF